MVKFHLDRFPVWAERSEYAEVVTVVEEWLTSLSGVVALYALGGLSAPGISDIDRIAVVDPGVGPLSSGWESLSPRERYVAMHTPFLVDVETFRVHRWLAYLEPLTWVWGESLPIDPPPADDDIPVRLGIEHLVMTRVRLEKVIHVGRIDVRALLCELNNLQHDLRLAGVGEDVAPSAWDVVREVDSLRSNWWDMTETGQSSRVIQLPTLATRGIDEALVAFGPVAGMHDSMRLPGYWGNVTLQADDQARQMEPGVSLGRTVSARSRRLSELRWRLARRRLSIPTDVIAYLWAQSNGESDVLVTRKQYATRYLEFMSSQPGWSSIGVAGSIYR